MNERFENIALHWVVPCIMLLVVVGCDTLAVEDMSPSWMLDHPLWSIVVTALVSSITTIIVFAIRDKIKNGCRSIVVLVSKRRDASMRGRRERLDQLKKECKRLEKAQSLAVNKRFVNAMPYDLRVAVPDGEAILRSVVASNWPAFFFKRGEIECVSVNSYETPSLDDVVATILRNCEGKDDPIVLLPVFFSLKLDSADVQHVLLLKRACIPEFDSEGRMISIVPCGRKCKRLWLMDEERIKGLLL